MLHCRPRRFTLVLILASLMPCVLGIGGWFSGIGALVLGAIFLWRTIVFGRVVTRSPDHAMRAARQVLRMSLLFLPALLLLLVLDILWNNS
jgi:heme O synthase-like polyprenyltransferase